MRREIPSRLKGMWLFVIFDLPVVKKKQRKAYSQFRKKLISFGFSMLQYSVYARYCTSRENSVTYTGRIKKDLPGEGQVRFISITDKQFADQDIFYGKKQEKPEDKPQQMLLF